MKCFEMRKTENFSANLAVLVTAEKVGPSNRQAGASKQFLDLVSWPNMWHCMLKSIVIWIFLLFM